MDKLLVKGPVQLEGEVRISGAKNACLPIMAATLLNPQSCQLTNVPRLRDVQTMQKLLERMGVKVECEFPSLKTDASELTSYEASYDLVKTMRASILVLGPLLARFKTAKVSLPGGCAIGTRPIDIHLDGLKKMGAEVRLESGYVVAETSGLVGSNIMLPFPSVGATENLMMAAVLADGKTMIENAAKEPEIVDLANFLNKMGAKIQGAGTHCVVVEGVKLGDLKACEHRVISDRIETATFVIAALMTNSNLLIKDCDAGMIDPVLSVLRSAGANIETGPDFIRVEKHSGLKSLVVETRPHPGFPTDVQAQTMALGLVTEGTTMVTETVFENRFMHVPELQRMGGNILQKGQTAMIEGKKPLNAAPVMCTDLRASAALILTALVSEGVTEISRVYHLDRGYEKIDQKLKALGVSIERVSE